MAFEELKSRLHEEHGPNLQIVLGNPFDPLDALLDPSDDPRSGSQWPPATNAARLDMHDYNDARRNFLGLFEVFDSVTAPQRIEIRLLKKYPVPYSLIITDEYVFVEHYLPSQPGGSLFTLQIEMKALTREPYARYRNDFSTRIFTDAEPSDVVLRRFLLRKRMELAERSTKQTDALLKSIERAFVIANRWVQASGVQDTGGFQADTATDNSLKPFAWRSRNRAYALQQEAYWRLIEYINKNDISRAVLIQYSGKKVEEVLLALMKQETKIDLYLQSPERSIGKRQSQRIQESLDQMGDAVLTSEGKGQINLIQYQPPASMRGILLDDKVLAIGSYIYHHTVEGNRAYPDDSIRIHGHDAPGLLLWSGTQEYEVFKSAFIRLAKNLKDGATKAGRLVSDMNA